MTLSIDQQGVNSWHFKPGYVAGLATLFLLMGAAQDGIAASLGDIVSVSPIGQPLRVEISSPGSRGDQIAACIRAPSPPSPDGVPSVVNARVSATGRDENARIVITHPDPAGEPILRLTLENTCTSRLRREYVLLLTEPLELAVPPSPRAVRTTTAPRVAPTIPRGTQTWVTFPGESVDSLAQAMYPRDAGARRAFTTGVLSANPRVFGAAADTSAPLPPGTELNMPSAANIIARASAQRPQGSPRSEPPAARPAAQTRVQPASAARTQAIPPGQEPATDRLLLEQAASVSVIDQVGLGAQASQAAREEHVVAAIDRTIDTQLELMQRLRQLEEIQLALRAELEAEDLTGSPPEQQARVAPLPEAIPEASAEHIPERTSAVAADVADNWPGLAAMFAAVALLLALLLRRGESSASPVRSTRAGNIGRRGKLDEITREPGAVTTPTGFDEQPTQEDRVPSGSTAKSPSAVALEWDDSDHPTEPGMLDVSTVPPLTRDEDITEEHESAVELADIMVSFGRLQGAAETLADFIRSNPKQALTPWLKLMDVYRIADMKPEFDALARQLNKTFNVKAVTWDNFDEARKHGGSVEAMPHILKRITKTWRTRECQEYLETIVRDNREGTRQGFGLGVIDDILVLSSVLDEQLGRYKLPVQ